MELLRLNKQYLTFRPILEAAAARKCHLRLVEPFSFPETVITTDTTPDEWHIEPFITRGYEGDEESYRLVYVSEGQLCFILPLRADSIEFRYEGKGFAGHIVMIVTMETR